MVYYEKYYDGEKARKRAVVLAGMKGKITEEVRG
jgi:hypothetical protein